MVGTDHQMYLTPDSSMYLRLAQNILAHGEFSESTALPLKPDTIRTPGYPLFLTPFSNLSQTKIMWVVGVQAIIGSLSAGLLFLTANVVWKKTSIAFPIGLAMAFDFVIILYSAFIMTECLFLFILILSFLCFSLFLNSSLKDPTLATLSGLLMGMSTLIRPVSLYYFIVPFLVGLYVLIINQRRFIRPLALFLVASIFLPSIWMTRNKIVVGDWTFTTIQGLTRASILEERLSKISYEEASEKLEGKFQTDHPEGFKNHAEEASAKSLWSLKFISQYPYDYSIVLLQEAVRLLAGNGMKAAAWMFFKDREHNPYTILVHPKESNQTQAKNLFARHPILGIGMIAYLAILATTYFFFLCGIVLGWKENKPVVLWLVLTTLYFFLVSIGFGTGARYRVPLMPSILLLAGLGLNQAREFLKKKR